jgi:spore coat protein U-like protein
MILRRARLALPLLLLACTEAGAQITCDADMSDLAFGAVDPQSSQTDATANFSYTCRNGSFFLTYSARVCFSIGDGAQGAGQTNPRQMQDGAGDVLTFQLYQNASRSLVWGSDFFGVFSTPLEQTVTLSAGRSVTRTATLYGRVTANQTGAIPGSYLDSFSGGHTAITINDTSGSAAPSTCDTSITGSFPFQATATVQNRCTVSASTLDFGAVGLLNSTRTANSTLSVQCANGTAYNVGLDAGLNAGGNINARKMALGAARVGYQLYSNAARTSVWGNTVGTNTVAGTGTGAVQNLTVYGSVPAQATPAAGTYNDTIVVTVTY